MILVQKLNIADLYVYDVTTFVPSWQAHNLLCRINEEVINNFDEGDDWTAKK